ALSDSDIAAMFQEKPLKFTTISEELSDEQPRSLRRFLVRHRNTFALNDKNPGVINAAAVTIDTKDRPPGAFPLRPTMPHMRPVLEAHVNEMLKYGIIRHSESPWAAALLLIEEPQVPKEHQQHQQQEQREAWSHNQARTPEPWTKSTSSRRVSSLESHTLSP
ncbi:unnamed protein product, partial [marine sediment metagenome]